MKSLKHYFRKFFNQPHKERRRSPRYPAQDEFRVEFRSNKIKRWSLGHGRDISLHGVRFVTPVKPGKHEVLELSVYFPHTSHLVSPIKLKAKVIRRYRYSKHNRWRIGCEFIYEEVLAKDTIVSFNEWLKGKCAKH